MNEKLKVNSKKYKSRKFDVKAINLESINAITLISLVITIVALIILVSVAIYLSLDNNGIFTRAKQAKEATNKQEATDIINLKITTAQMNKYAEKQEMPTLKELSVVLGADNEIQYVTEKSQVASTKYEVGENPSSIYTKLNKYPYEFEINGQLQLASINGVKVTNNAKLVKKVIANFWTDPRSDQATAYYGTKTFDVKESIPNYNELTKDNFCLQANNSCISYTSDLSTQGAASAAYKILSYENGIVTIELGKGVREGRVAQINFSLIAFYID